MLYPIGFLVTVGEILMQLDFIGPRYIDGCSTPIHFLSLRYIRPFKWQLFFRVTAQTTSEILRILSIVFFELLLPLPDVVQQDNGSSFKGSLNQPGVVGRYIKWWCHNGVIVVFNAPRSPWNTGAVEGANGIFDRKFWQRFRFTSIQEIDEKLHEFNAAYGAYLKTDIPFPKRAMPAKKPSTVKTLRDLVGLQQPFLFLLRVVHEDRFGKYTIEVLNRYITFSPALSGQFVIVQIHLVDQWMCVWQERGNHTALILSRRKFSVSSNNYGRRRKRV